MKDIIMKDRRTITIYYIIYHNYEMDKNITLISY